MNFSDFIILKFMILVPLVNIDCFKLKQRKKWQEVKFNKTKSGIKYLKNRYLATNLVFKMLIWLKINPTED